MDIKNNPPTFDVYIQKEDNRDQINAVIGFMASYAAEHGQELGADGPNGKFSLKILDKNKGLELARMLWHLYGQEVKGFIRQDGRTMINVDINEDLL